jgi:hypothetical protein
MSKIRRLLHWPLVAMVPDQRLERLLTRRAAMVLSILPLGADVLALEFTTNFVRPVAEALRAERSCSTRASMSPSKMADSGSSAPLWNRSLCVSRNRKTLHD